MPSGPLIDSACSLDTDLDRVLIEEEQLHDESNTDQFVCHVDMDKLEEYNIEYNTQTTECKSLR